MEDRAPVPESVNEARLDELRGDYENLWSTWASHEGSRQEGSDHDDEGDCRDISAKIPFPSGPRRGNMLHIHRHMDFKAYIRKAVLRWHPGED